MFAIAPHFVEDREFEIGCIKSRLDAVDDFAIDADFAILNEAATVFSGAESLRLQDAV
jgi:hypothetical protein